MKMKKLLCLLLAGVMMLLPLVGCGIITPPNVDPTEPTNKPTEPAEPTEPEIEPLPKDKKYNILFIGNSYTKRASMPTAIFEPMAKAAGYDVKVTAILNGGHTLELFANPNDTYGAQVAAALSPENYGKYDYVVIQEQSLRPVIDTEKFYDGARALVEKIRAAGATPVLYNHWGRKTGSPDLITYNMTNETMTWKLAAVGEAIGKELDMPVAYVGLAFYDIYTNKPNIELYDPDLYHPIYNGSFLAAATIFAKIFGVDPTTVPYAGDLVDPKAIVELPKAAKNAVFYTPEIPEEYRTTTSSPVGPTNPTEPVTPGLLYADHLIQLPDNVCQALNLWTALEHDSYYYDGSKWATTVPSITISVNPGDHIYATSFGRHGENGHNSKDGIRVTFFSEYGVVRSLSPNETYAEYLTNGYLTVPEGAVAVNIPLWNGAANKEVYILNRDHCYENDVCIGCGSNAETGPA